ncbi:hypothetical protein GGF43_000326 [Coemansia sp. RSA 2618]|nr:hypothetical protein GGF43_000326 [Coemansia sp. RSA 2618]
MDGEAAHYDVVNITVHPDFNPSNYANNFAILQFNLNGTIIFQTPISPVADYKWEKVGYDRSIPVNLITQKWNGFNYELDTIDHDDTCDNLSPMYAANSKDMTCTSVISNPAVAYADICSVPLGVVYGFANNDSYIIGPYSHTVFSDGDSYCSFSNQRSYYTSLANYIPFIISTLGRNLVIDNDFFKANLSSLSADHKMIDKEFPESKLNVTTKTGDFYKGLPPGIGMNVNPNAADDAANSDSGGGLSSRDTVIVAVCVSLGAATIIVLVLLYVFWYRKYKRSSKYPIGQAQYQDMIEQTIGGASTHGHQQFDHDDVPPNTPLAPQNVYPDGPPPNVFADSPPPMSPLSPMSQFMPGFESNRQSFFLTELPPVYDEGIENMVPRMLTGPSKNEPDLGNNMSTK